MQIEVSLPNRDGALLPGAYVQISLLLQASNELVISTNTLMFRSDGLRVASVDASGRVHLLPIKVDRDFGRSVEVLYGVQRSERLVLNPSDFLVEEDIAAVVSAVKEAK